MKTTNKYFSKYCSFAIFMLMFSLMLPSCKVDGKGMRYPIPSENPVSLGAAAETKVITVKDIVEIDTENKTDIRQYDPKTGIMTIKNDWITIVLTHIENSYDMRLTIKVKENTLNATRTYNLGMSGKPGTKILVITQNGKVD